MPVKVKWADMTGGDVHTKKSATTSRAFLVTVVFLYDCTYMGREEFEKYKRYLDMRAKKWFEDRTLANTIVEDARALAKEPDVNVLGSTEVNEKGYVHHHALVQMAYERLVKDNGHLVRIGFDWKKVQRDMREWFRDLVGLEGPIALKIDIKNLGADSIDNVIRYIFKKN